MPRKRREQPRLKKTPPAPAAAGEPLEARDARLVGDAVRALRERRGLLQNELAALAGLPASQISAVEHGRRQPSLRTLRRLCAALGATLADLLRAATGHEAPPDPAAAPDAFLPGLQDLFSSPEDALFAPLARRGVVRTTRADSVSAPLPSQETVEALERRILDYLRLETICGAFPRASIPLSLPFRQDAEGAEQLAGDVRKMLGLGDSIVLDYVSVLESHGVRVLFLALPRGLESLSFYAAGSGSAIVVLSEATTPEKQLFRLALELAWLYLFTRNGNRPVPESGEANRHFAKLFAACFLLPRAAVLGAAASLGAGRGDWSLPLLLRVKRRFGTSAEAFAYRLFELGLLSETGLSGLLEAIRAHYETHQNREPGEALPPLARDGRLGDLIERARTVPGAHDEVRAIARRAGVF